MKTFKVLKEYPLKYYCFGTGTGPGESDRDFILARMRYIPDNMKDDVSNKYEKIYGTGFGRKEANTFLNDIAQKFSKEPCDQAVVNGCYGQMIEQVKAKKSKEPTSSGTKSSGKYTGQSILEMAAQIK